METRRSRAQNVTSWPRCPLVGDQLVPRSPCGEGTSTMFPKLNLPKSGTLLSWLIRKRRRWTWESTAKSVRPRLVPQALRGPRSTSERTHRRISQTNRTSTFSSPTSATQRKPFSIVFCSNQRDPQSFTCYGGEQSLRTPIKVLSLVAGSSFSPRSPLVSCFLPSLCG